MTPKQLQTRWNLSDAADVDVASLVLSITKNFTYSPFGVHDGRLDFRGILFRGKYYERDDELPLPPMLVTTQLIDVHIKDADFSYSSFEEVHIFSGSLINCLFYKAKLENLITYDKFQLTIEPFDETPPVISEKNPNLISDCVFNETKLYHCSFFASIFSKTHFIKTKWKAPCFQGSTLNECVFQSDINGLNLHGAIISHSKFIGRIYDGGFSGWEPLRHPHPRYVETGSDIGQGYWLETPYEMVPNQFSGVDFSQANLVMCTWRNYCYLHECILPPLDTHCVFEATQAMYDLVLKKINATCTNSSEQSRRDKMIDNVQTFYKPLASRPHKVHNIEDFSKYDDEATRKMLFKITCEASEELGVRIYGRPKRIE